MDMYERHQYLIALFRYRQRAGKTDTHIDIDIGNRYRQRLSIRMMDTRKLLDSDDDSDADTNRDERYSDVCRDYWYKRRWQQRLRQNPQQYFR